MGKLVIECLDRRIRVGEIAKAVYVATGQRYEKDKTFTPHIAYIYGGYIASQKAVLACLGILGIGVAPWLCNSHYTYFSCAIVHRTPSISP